MQNKKSKKKIDSIKDMVDSQIILEGRIVEEIARVEGIRDFCIKRLSDGNRFSKINSLQILQNMDYVPSVSVISDLLLNDPDFVIRKDAARVIEKKLMVQCYPHLIKALKDECEDVQQSVAETLKVIATAESISPFIRELFADGSGVAARGALCVVEEMKLSGFLQQVKEIASNFSCEFCWRAFSILGDIAKQEDKEDLLILIREVFNKNKESLFFSATFLASQLKLYNLTDELIAYYSKFLKRDLKYREETLRGIVETVISFDIPKSYSFAVYLFTTEETEDVVIWCAINAISELPKESVNRILKSLFEALGEKNNGGELKFRILWLIVALDSPRKFPEGLAYSLFASQMQRKSRDNGVSKGIEKMTDCFYQVCCSLNFPYGPNTPEIRPLKEEYKTLEHVFQPNKPYTNIRIFRELMLSCEDYIWWFDRYFEANGLDLFYLLLNENKKIKHVRILSADKSKVRSFNQTMYSALEHELHEVGVKIEWRVLTSAKAYSSVHDRWLLDKNNVFLLPPLLSILKHGQYTVLKKLEEKDLFRRRFLYLWRNGIKLVELNL